MKFLVPNYSCLQIRGLPPPDPRSLCPQSSTEFVEPLPKKNPGYATDPDHPTLSDLISWKIFGEKSRSSSSSLCNSLRNTVFSSFLHIISSFPFTRRRYLIWIMVNKYFHLQSTFESSFCLSLPKSSTLTCNSMSDRTSSVALALSEVLLQAAAFPAFGCWS